jgi:UPF0176 protein
VPAPPVLNVSAYRFVALNALPALRERLHADAARRGLKGTVLLAEEGINLFLAGAPDAVRGWLAALREDARFAGLQAKESYSARQPFQRLLVKVKREIIRMDCPALQPAAGRAPAVDAATLRRWLDQGRRDDHGREVLLLDTRNAFEVDVGAFEGAVDWRIAKFSEFPQAAAAQLAALQGKTVVTYCTGGIRCEKAALVLQAAGVERALQLDGGILKYFEEAGGAHWRGRCFVFDERVSLGPALDPLPAPAAA